MPYAAIRFIRHGTAGHMGNPDTIAGRSPRADLTEHGIEQAWKRGARWSSEGYKPDVVKTSPIWRCRSTAGLALMAAGLQRMTLERCDELAEMCQGSLEGRTRTPEIAAEMERLRGSFRAPGTNEEGLAGETFGDVADRWVAFLGAQSLAATVAGGNVEVAAFSHRVFLGTGLSYLALRQASAGDVITSDAIRDRYMATRASVPLEPCSETLIVVEPAGTPEGFDFRVEYVGQPV